MPEGLPLSNRFNGLLGAKAFIGHVFEGLEQSLATLLDRQHMIVHQRHWVLRSLIAMTS